MNDTKTALNYLHQSLKIKLQLKNKRSIANTYNNIGELYLKEGNTEQANDFFNKALNIRRELNDMPAIAETMFNFGCLYQQNSETEKAIQSFNEVLNIYKSTNNKLGRANTLSELGKTYMLIDSLSKAKIYFEEALSTIKKENIPLAISLISKDYAILLAKMNEFDKAYMLLQQSNAYFDTISERQPGINLEYYSASISKLRTQLSVQEKLTNKYYRIIILLGSCILLVILVFAWKHFATNNKRKNELKSLHNQIEELQQQKSGFDEILQKEVEIQTITLQNEISERLKIDAELKKALKRAEDANYLKNAFLSNISHEIRTPLNGIIGFAALLETELSRIENQELYDYANGISQSGERLLHLLTNLIDISRLEANDLVINLEEVDLPSILNDATTIFKFKANEKGIRFNLQGNPCPLAIADSNNLMRVLSDLIDNSLKYTEKGFINISCGVSERSNELFIRVKDTGIGIDPSYLPSIFEAFRQESLGFSRAYQGAGLGLPLAKRLVELMKGRIEIVSEKGLGTTVTVFLKQSSKSSALKTPMPDTALISSIEFHDRPINILIIEDDRMNRMVLKKMLENVGELTLAIDGDNALDLVKKNLSKNFVFDIMLVDINLPSPWDGVKLLKKIKQDYKQYTSIPFIAQTAYAMSGDKERFLESGFDDYISKPVSKNHLLNIIQKHIKSGN
jgi:signal transduction histidine kinase/CheY-like chemotaxis protein